MRPWIPIALLALSTVVLGTFVVRLDAEVRRLSRAVGATTDSKKSKSGSDADAALTGRVTSLEKELEATNGRVALLYARQQLAGAQAAQEAPPEKTKEEVLSIVTDEADRVLVKHLLWHRKNLMAARKPGFQAFAHQAALDEGQSQAVWSQLEAEGDEFVNLLRIPELREDPEALTREVRAVLAATDDRVRRLLNQHQIELYDAGRAFERAALMPWLPPDSP